MMLDGLGSVNNSRLARHPSCPLKNSSGWLIALCIGLRAGTRFAASVFVVVNLRHSAVRAAVLVAVVLSMPSCASLEGLRAFIQPPRFEQDDQSRSEIRLRGTSGAAVRIWTRVSNPNSFGLTLGTLQGTLRLEGSRAAAVDFPFGLPLQPHSEEIVPIDLSIDFRDVPGLGQAIARAVTRQPISFELEGTIGVSAGRFGEQRLGPMTWLRGELR